MSPMKTRKAEEISMVDKDLWFISFLSFIFAEMDFGHLISSCHCLLQFKLDDVNSRYWQKNWCEEVISIDDIGMMTAVECRSSLGIYLHLLWFDEQSFRLFYCARFSAVEKICAELAMRSARPLRRPLNSLTIEDMWCETPKTLIGIASAHAIKLINLISQYSFILFADCHFVYLQHQRLHIHSSSILPIQSPWLNLVSVIFLFSSSLWMTIEFAPSVPSEIMLHSTLDPKDQSLHILCLRALRPTCSAFSIRTSDDCLIGRRHAIGSVRIELW
jgi:hypothetical protein